MSKINEKQQKWLAKRIADKGIPSPLYPYEVWEYMQHMIEHLYSDDTDLLRGSDHKAHLILAQFNPGFLAARVRGKLSIQEASTDLLKFALDLVRKRKGRFHLRNTIDLLLRSESTQPAAISPIILAQRLATIVDDGADMNIFDIDARNGEMLLATAVVKYAKKCANVTYTGIAASTEAARGLSSMARFLKIDAKIYPPQPAGQFDTFPALAYIEPLAIEANIYVYIVRRMGGEYLGPEDKKRGAAKTNAGFVAEAFDRIAFLTKRMETGDGLIVVGQDFTDTEPRRIAAPLEGGFRKAIDRGDWAKHELLTAQAEPYHTLFSGVRK